MTDRELLELAAKAADLKIEWSESTQCFWLESGDSWAPDLDDGDALRLLVALGLEVATKSNDKLGDMQSYVSGMPLGGLITELHNGDRYAATRRAIVRAAAEIGKGMP